MNQDDENKAFNNTREELERKLQAAAYALFKHMGGPVSVQLPFAPSHTVTLTVEPRT